jgi:hypothetical protein
MLVSSGESAQKRRAEAKECREEQVRKEAEEKAKQAK